MTSELFQQYLDGACTPAEKRQVEEWLRMSDEKELDALLIERWNNSHETFPEQPSKLLWQQLKATIQPERQARIVPFSKTARRVAMIAASVLLISLLAWLFIPRTGNTLENNTSIARRFTLPDSSTVWLNAWSTLQYNGSFNQQKREVTIRGEAYFIVKEDKTRPFIVYTPTIAARVLGTEFNVEAYGNEPTVKISLNKGKVAISYVQQDTVLLQPVKTLLPGEMLSVKKDKTNLQVQSIAVKKVQAWTEGHFVINDLALPEVVQRMEKKFGIRFHYTNQQMASSGERIAATFTGESWQQIIQQICFTCNLHCEIKNKEVYLYQSQ